MAAASSGIIKIIINLSRKYNSAVLVLTEALLESYSEGHHDVVNWLDEHTAADAIYNDDDFTPLIAACRNNYLNI